MKPLIDSFGRRIDYLRLSVTDRCDLRCTYCMAEKMVFLPRKELLSIEELVEIATLFVSRGTKTIRLTGGEPLVRKGIDVLLEALGGLVKPDGLRELTLTTNATQLDQFAELLVRAGVKRINVSLDSLDEVVYSKITRGGALAKALAGIQAAQEAGLKIKLNAVALKKDNAEHLPELISWAHDRKIDVSLIETMPLGETGEDRFDHYLPLDEVKRSLSERWTLIDSAHKTAGPSRYVKVEETGGLVGFITPLTNNFCASCNRVRITCTGVLYGCLGRSQSVNLRDVLREGDDLNKLLDEALLSKPKAHDFSITEENQAPAQARHMSVTGG